jgi:uncharacterized membrane protein
MGSAAQYFEVEAPVAKVYAYWRDFSNFPSFMPDVEEVTVTGPMTSHWKVSGPLGTSVEWDAEIVEDLVSLEYNPPGGKAGELVAELFKDPDKQVQRAVDGFRKVVESGGLAR